MSEMGEFGVPIEGLHTETGPGVYEAAILFSEALEAADRAILFKTGAKEIGSRFGIMPSFMAKWNQHLPGLLGPHSPVAVRRQEEPLPRSEGQEQHEQAVRELSRRTGRRAHGVRADVLADDQQLQAAGRRLLGAGQAHVGRRQPDGELSRDLGLAQVDAARNALPGRRHEPLSRGGRGARRGPRRRREEAEAHRQADPRHQPGRGEHSARAAHADRDDAHLPRFRARARLVRRRFRRPLRGDARMGMAAVARRRHRLGNEALLESSFEII